MQGERENNRRQLGRNVKRVGALVSVVEWVFERD